MLIAGEMSEESSFSHESTVSVGGTPTRLSTRPETKDAGSRLSRSCARVRCADRTCEVGHRFALGQRPLFGRSGLGGQSDLIGTPEPMGIASALPAPDGNCSRAAWCLSRKVTGTGPHGRWRSTPHVWCCGGRTAAARGAGAGARPPATPPCTGQLTG
jgi:hypothetical protein